MRRGRLIILTVSLAVAAVKLTVSHYLDGLVSHTFGVWGTIVYLLSMLAALVVLLLRRGVFRWLWSLVRRRAVPCG